MFKRNFVLAFALAASMSVDLVCMDQFSLEHINPLIPLHTILNEYVTDTLIKESFNKAFCMICDIVSGSCEPRKVKVWLESDKLHLQIDECVRLIKEHINQMYYGYCQTVCLSQNFSFNAGAGQLLCHNFQVLEGEQASLHRKIAAMSSFIEKAILSGRSPAYFNNSEQSKHVLEKQIMWENVKTGAKYALGMAIAGIALYCYSHML